MHFPAPTPPPRRPAGRRGIAANRIDANDLRRDYHHTAPSGTGIALPRRTTVPLPAEVPMLRPSHRSLRSSLRRSRRTARAGFSLIELLIVVLVIGILAMIAIPALANTKGKANLAKVRSDLRTLSVAQEGYFYENGTYAPSLSAVGVLGSPGVTLTLQGATSSPTGWAATAEFSGAAPNRCAIFYGDGAAAPATQEGVIACQ